MQESKQTTISFDNTQIAFASKNNKELNRAYWLFKAIGINVLVKMGPPMVNLAMKLRLPIKGIIRNTIFAHFCGGETIEDCNTTIQSLGKYNIGTILDYSVEGEESEEDFENCKNEIIRTIQRAKGSKDIPFCVFKVTGIGRFALLEKNDAKIKLSVSEELEFENIRSRVEEICSEAFNADVPVFIDAEESWIQDTIDMLAREMMLKYNKETTIVYNTIQLYRHDRLQFLKDSISDSEQQNYFLGVKLVRGAYMEKERARATKLAYPSPIQADKSATDKDYDAALELCLRNYNRVAICAGTHNENSSRLLTVLMDKNQVPSGTKQIYFSQLLGMSDHLSYNLADAGYNVAKYVPYGPVDAVLPYLFRRANENTSISGQMGRELSLILKEKKRREDLKKEL